MHVSFTTTTPVEKKAVQLMCVWVAARFYFLLNFVDAYSRYIVHHKLLISLDGKSVALELQAALEGLKGAKPGSYTITVASSSIAMWRQ